MSKRIFFEEVDNKVVEVLGRMAIEFLDSQCLNVTEVRKVEEFLDEYISDDIDRHQLYYYDIFPFIWQNTSYNLYGDVFVEVIAREDRG